MAGKAQNARKTKWREQGKATVGVTRKVPLDTGQVPRSAASGWAAKVGFFLGRRSYGRDGVGKSPGRFGSEVAGLGGRGFWTKKVSWGAGRGPWWALFLKRGKNCDVGAGDNVLQGGGEVCATPKLPRKGSERRKELILE